ncbi:hypothetical protein PybrP1_003620 [[Pythium] brassicae (nom. inval.)]|nr:hypothetical protein PybrP1_003620 [[Pythium] brassicae (nom. inval.)]
MLCAAPRSRQLPARALLWSRRFFSSSSAGARDGPLLYRDLARTFQQIEQAKQSRDASVQLLAAQFREVLQSSSASPSELASALYLTASQLAPPHEGIELRFGTRLFAPVIEQLVAPGAERSAALEIHKFPDFGTAVQSLIDSGRIVVRDDASDEDDAEPHLTAAYVHEELLRLAGEDGSGAVARKQQRAVELLRQCRSAEEMVFLARMLAHQSLRIAMGEKSILAALASASAPTPSEPNALLEASTTESAADPALKAWTESVTRAYAQRPDYAALARLLVNSQHERDLATKVAWLDARAAPTVGVPVLTMSAYPVASLAAVVERTRKTANKTATCEFKYDGARVQVHLSAASAGSDAPRVRRIFSRNMEDTTDKYASLLPVLQRQLRGGHEVVVEGEVVAVDRATQRFLPFQVLQTKTTTDFCLFVFDLLHVDGDKLLRRSLRERRTLLRTLLVEDPGRLEFVKSIDIAVANDDDNDDNDDDASRVRAFLRESVAAGCEGLMVKALDGADADYKAGVRSYSWMKVKQDYLVAEEAAGGGAKRASQLQQTRSSEHGAFLPDTLDLVPIGAFYGKGRRAGVFGSFLLATFDAASGKFETIGKVGTGFSDAQLQEIAERMTQQTAALADGSVPSNVASAATRSRQPDVWLQPSEVWEIKATQLTSSPAYTCASQSEPEPALLQAAARSKGLALRFPRFLRFRGDKRPEQATDSAQVAELFRQQTANQNGE